MREKKDDDYSKFYFVEKNSFKNQNKQMKKGGKKDEFNENENENGIKMKINSDKIHAQIHIHIQKTSIIN